jgi:acetoin utilization deacetylase AcuC-like enzyme
MTARALSRRSPFRIIKPAEELPVPSEPLASHLSPRTTRPSGLLCDPFFALHQPHGNPESPLRIGAIQEGLAAAGLLENLSPIAPRDATAAEIQLIHTPRYFDIVKRDVQFGSGELSTGDTELSEHSLEVALRAAGGVLEAVDAVMTGRLRNAFCAVRPPGHHASPGRGMGFCIFNHVAIAARHAQRNHGIGKIAIVDFDVHHGNGTQDAFYDDPSILFFSSHQWPLYPGTGRRSETGTGPGLGLTFNAPLPAGSGYEEILGEVETRLEPALATFKPELLLLSAGFDSRIGDPLGDFTLEDEQFANLTRRIKSWAHDYAGDRLVSILEGGYNLGTLGGCVAAHVSALQEG